MPSFDITTNAVKHLQEHDWRLGKLIDKIGELPPHIPRTGFENLAHSIIEQMLSTKVAAVMEERLFDACGGSITPECVSALSVEGIKGIDISRKKAESLHHLATSVEEKDLAGLAEMHDDEIEVWLTSLPGIGPWTTHMFMLFHLERPDILPVDDLTFRKAFEWLYGAPVTNPSVREVVCSLWKPYSSYAARYLYRALDTGLMDLGTASEVLGV